ncbi:hypothetical protein [Spirosoma oryzicola]|uniref:hypothetical protein n=1 Tax=Spirosoma oryzicola TaxID=2898794 RepID=UPI001E6151B9|nr:hypothetical protein [Spirosoma oryzicola]UHG93340.1 hypothetical protein LQ777_10650 [Spirosoma oryzicola]
MEKPKSLSNVTQRANMTYVFPKQLIFLQSEAQRKTLLAGRAFGKTFLLLVCIGYFARMMGRAKFFLAGLTFAQLLNIVLVDMADAFAGIGWKEYDEKTGLGHYVLFKAPPSHWPKPFKAPKTYDRCITFITGFCLQLLSFENPDANRGGNYDGGLVDESALFKEDWINKILMPMLYRANTHRFVGNFMHNSLYDFTSNPWHESGKWVFKTEELMKRDPKKYFFIEGNCDDNPMLHPNYKTEQEAILSPMAFRIEVMNERIAKLPNCYYPSFEHDKHCSANTFKYDTNASGIWMPSFSDHNPGKPLEMSFDFNAGICSVIICQENPKELRVINSLYAKQAAQDQTLVETLCNMVVNAYDHHTKKEIILFGDAYGKSKSAGSKKTLYEQAIDVFKAKGWKVIDKVIRFNPDHIDKFNLIDKILIESSDQYPRVRINQNTCKALIISIQNSPIKTGFEKDKSSEESSIDQAYATHLSDCFDYILYAKYSTAGRRKSKGKEIRFL